MAYRGQGLAQTESDKLNKAIQGAGLKKKYIAECLGITSKSLQHKMYGDTQFLPTEITDIAKILKLSHKEVIEIFLPRL